MDGMVQTVALYGIEGATSKRIAAISEVNEAYLFRYFESLSDLKEKTFTRVLLGWVQAVKSQIESLSESHPCQNGSEEIFRHLWEVLLSSANDVRFFIRFIQSESFTKEVQSVYAEMCAKPLSPSAESKTAWHLGEDRLILICSYINLFFGREEKPSRETASRLFFLT